MATNPIAIIPTATANPRFPYVAYPLLLEELLALAVDALPVAEASVAADPVETSAEFDAAGEV